MSCVINHLKNPVVASLAFTGVSALVMGGSKAVSWLGRKVEAYGNERKEQGKIKSLSVYLGKKMKQSSKIFGASSLATALGALISVVIVSLPYLDQAARTWPRGEKLY